MVPMVRGFANLNIKCLTSVHWVPIELKHICNIAHTLCVE